MRLAWPEPQRDPGGFLGLTRAESSLTLGALLLSGTTHLLPARLRLPANLAIAALVSRWASVQGAGLDAQGMRPRDAPTGLAYGAAASGLIGLAIAGGVGVKHARGLYRADHVITASLPTAAYEVFLRIPLGTAYAEEVVFRGALLGLLLQRCSPREAALRCSVVFGLWHIVPTLHRIEANPVTRGRSLPVKAAWVVASVASTGVSGLMLAWLRLQSRSIVAPWLAHFTANAAGYTAAWMSFRSQAVLPEQSATD